MTGVEKIKNSKRVVALVIRKDANIANGINFFTKPKEPLQLALHNHTKRKETLIHSNKVNKPFLQSEKYKYIYMVKGKSTVELRLLSKKIVKTIELKKGDSIIIMDILHKVIFAPKSRAVEIKQGPYDKNNE